MKVLSRFDSSPYYFATTKGKTEITNELNMAILKLNEADPDFTLSLYRKYFEGQIDNSLILSNEEREYLNNIPTIKAIYVDNFEPVQYYDKITNSPKGIFVDIFNLIADNLKINFEYIKAKDYAEAYKLVNANKYTLIIGVPSNYKISKKHDILFTKSYMNFNLLNVYSKKSLSDSSNKILAFPNGFGYLNLKEGYEIKYYPTLKDCLIAVEKNEATFTYGNSYSISNYILNDYFSNLTVVTNHNLTPLSLALSNKNDKILFDILNKSILSLNTEDIQNLIYKDTTNTKYHVSMNILILFQKNYLSYAN